MAKKSKKTRSKVSDEQIREAYEATASDTEAGQAVGMTPEAFWYRRNKLKLPAKGKRSGSNSTGGGKRKRAAKRPQAVKCVACGGAHDLRDCPGAAAERASAIEAVNESPFGRDARERVLRPVDIVTGDADLDERLSSIIAPALDALEENKAGGTYFAAPGAGPRQALDVVLGKIVIGTMSGTAAAEALVRAALLVALSS